ncbi:hypothetical protein ACWGMA_12475 [Streptomyces asiaticus]
MAASRWRPKITIRGAGACEGYEVVLEEEGDLAAADEQGTGQDRDASGQGERGYAGGHGGAADPQGAGVWGRHAIRPYGGMPKDTTGAASVTSGDRVAQTCVATEHANLMRPVRSCGYHATIAAP